jgi:hypothetical protein
MSLGNQFSVKNNSVLTLESNKNFIHLDKNFIDWLVGFTDAEGNFNISLKGLQDNRYNKFNLPNNSAYKWFICFRTY